MLCSLCKNCCLIGDSSLHLGTYLHRSNRDGNGTKDTAACAATGERGMMVAMGHGLCVSFCVCGEAMKIRLDLKKVMASWSLLREVSNSKNLLVWRGLASDKMLVWTIESSESMLSFQHKLSSGM